MGGEQAAHVLAAVKTKSNDPNTEQSDVMKTYHQQSSVYYSTSRLWDDGIIDPSDSRRILGLSLAAVSGNPIAQYRPGVYRM